MDTKYDRQRRKQQAAVSVLCRDPSLLGDGRLRGRLQVIAGQVAGQAYRDSISRWSELLSSGDVGAVSRAVLDDTGLGAQPAWQPTLNHEHTAARWVPADQSEEWFMWPGQIAAIDEIVRSLLAEDSLSRRTRCQSRASVAMSRWS